METRILGFENLAMFAPWKVSWLQWRCHQLRSTMELATFINLWPQHAKSTILTTEEDMLFERTIRITVTNLILGIIFAAVGW